MNIAHRFMDNCRSMASYLTPIPTKSQFIEKGVWTPQEFVEAGDQLVFKFPTWQWQPANGSHEVPWLPRDKQYLITRSVSCRRRVKDLDTSLGTNVQEEDGWTIHEDPSPDGSDDIVALNMAGASCHPSIGLQPTENFVSAIHEDGSEEMPCCLDSLSLVSFQENDSASDPACDYFVRTAPGADIVRTRTYDLTITYDKYYQTPRLWLFGYDENGIPLRTHQIFEDMLTQYAKTTVTVDPHPCTGVPTASIHPCKHAEMMKKVVNSWIEKGVEPRHDLTLFVLLKFISSVVPTIDYDFTTEIRMI